MDVTKSAISKYHCFLPGNTPVGRDQLVQKAMEVFVSGCVLDFVQVLAQCFFAVIYDNYKINCFQYCIACNVSTLECSHNRVSSLASLGRLVVLEEGFAQVPLTGWKR